MSKIRGKYYPLIALLIFVWANAWCQEPKAYVLLVGLERVDHKVYGNKYPDKSTAGAGADIANVKYMLANSGFTDSQISVLFNETATKQRVIDSLNAFSKKTKKTEDLIVFYFTGHGDGFKDFNEDEADGQDEVLVCYDKLLFDDELIKIWRSFSQSARILMIVDACHSGTTYKMLDHKVNFISVMKSIRFRSELQFDRLLSSAEGQEVYSDADEPFQMIYMSAAKDSEEAIGGVSSQFTSALLSVFNLYQHRKNEWRELTYNEYWSQVALTPQGQGSVFAIIGKFNEMKKDYPYKIK